MDKVMRLNKARNCLIIILSGYNNIDEVLYSVLLAIIDNITLMFIDRKT